MRESWGLCCHIRFAMSSGIILETLGFVRKIFLSVIEITCYVCLQTGSVFASSQE